MHLKDLQSLKIVGLKISFEFLNVIPPYRINLPSPRTQWRKYE